MQTARSHKPENQRQNPFCFVNLRALCVESLIFFFCLSFIFCLSPVPDTRYPVPVFFSSRALQALHINYPPGCSGRRGHKGSPRRETFLGSACRSADRKHQIRAMSTVPPGSNRRRAWRFAVQSACGNVPGSHAPKTVKTFLSDEGISGRRMGKSVPRA